MKGIIPFRYSYQHYLFWYKWNIFTKYHKEYKLFCYQLKIMLLRQNF